MPPPAKILIIDDEEVVLDSCLQILAGRDYQVATTQDGLAGLTLTQESRPDLVIVDLKMPGISGFEVLEKIRAIDPTIVPIVITGYATVSSAVEAMKRGAFDFLPKPFTPEELRLITERGLEKRRLVLETIALRRETEMLRENFAAIVSHELRSPLGAIQQNVYALAAELADSLSADQKHRLDRIQVRLADLLALVHTWLRVFAVDVDKLKEQFAPVSITTPITKAVETMQSHATRKDVTITTNVAAGLRPVAGDEGSLTETLVNLIGNAVKYSHPGGEIVVKAAAEGDQIVLSVTDVGVGIARENLPYVFNDFYRGGPGPAAESGCGLGLAVSRRIVEAHAGTISVESEPGRGSTFQIRLPALNSVPCVPSPTTG
ncbi:HAMP domain-containing histidine kinase, partial [bacterium]|nr:HAMP domain-containing histidine kinase [bacterium]